MTLISGNQLVVDTLKEFGTSTVFTLHGGHLDGIYRHATEAGIRLVDTRHEQAAGFAAQAYAKVTGKVSVAMATAGGGITNLATPMASSWADAVPVVFIGAAPPLRDFDALPVNSGYDQMSVAQGITKWSHQATVTEQLPQVLARAFQIAAAGRPGPVYLNLPTDVLFARVDANSVTIPSSQSVPSIPAGEKGSVAELARRLATAERPAILVGGGSVYPDASVQLDELARKFRVPILTNNKSKGVIPTDHELAGGGFTALASVSKRTGNAADLVVLLGARFGLYTGGRRGSVIPENAFVVQVDTMTEEIGRMHDIDLGITAGVAPLLEQLLATPDPDGLPETRDEWASFFQRSQQSTTIPDPQSVLSPAQLAQQIAKLAPEDSLYVLDGGETPSWLDAVVTLDSPRRWLGHGYIGVMGEGLPHAVGAQVARPEAPVICFTGDGALGYCLAEFDTLARHELPVIVIVNNDQGWAMSQHGQDLLFGENNHIISDLSASRYDQIAEAFGVNAEFVERADQFESAFHRALQHDGPTCINVVTKSSDIAAVTRRFVGEAASGPITPDGRARVPYAEGLAV